MKPLLEWIGTICQCAGALWVAANIATSGFAFPLMLIGSLIWLGVGAHDRRWSLVVLKRVFAAINVVGVWRWLG